jgi:6-phosphogluconolactonase (cycloisomerase 2 family)
VNTNGSLASFSRIVLFDGKSVNKERQERSHIHSAIFSPDQHYLFLPDLGADRIWRLSFDPLKEPPIFDTAIQNTYTVPGSGPRHFVFHPYLGYAYCIEELSGTVQAYAYTGDRLDTIQRIAAHYKKHKGDYSSADIHISPDGRFLYASNRGKENNIAIFAIDCYTGKLKLIGLQSTFGDHPRNFIIDPTGRFLLAANQISGDVVVFRRNLQTGLLIKTNIKIKVPGASCLQIHSY